MARAPNPAAAPARMSCQCGKIGVGADADAVVDVFAAVFSGTLEKFDSGCDPILSRQYRRPNRKGRCSQDEQFRHHCPVAAAAALN